MLHGTHAGSGLVCTGFSPLASAPMLPPPRRPRQQPDSTPPPSSKGPIVLRRQHELRPHEIPLGWSLDAPQRLGFGSDAKKKRSPARRLVALTGDSHLMTIAPTGAGKGRGCTIPWLLHLHNPAIVLDVKGEAWHVTARYRREVLGQQTLLLDPFGMCGGNDSLNPFDLVRKDHLEADAESLTELFLDGRPPSTKDPFWDIVSRAFFVGLVAHVATTCKDPDPKTLRDLLQDTNLPARIEAMLLKGEVQSPLARREFQSFLAHEHDKVRTSVLSTAQQNIRAFATDEVARAMSKSSLQLDDVIRGKPMTIYLAIPPENLASHGGVLRMWVGALLQAVTRRKGRPAANTVFLLDEVAQCGTLPILRQAMSLLRGYGLTTITLWQDLGQLQRCYDDWRSLINNCAAVQTFGPSTYEMARTMGEIIGVSPQQLRAMLPEQSMVAPAGAEPFVVRRMDYLTDAMFRGRAAPNPWFERPADDRRDEGAAGGPDRSV